MRLIDDLISEHRLIERVAGSLVTFATQRAQGAGDAADGARFLEFFRVWADGWHHGREEGVLFPALVRDAELPNDRGPIAMMVADHRRFEKLVAELTLLTDGAHEDAASRAKLPLVAKAYAHGLWKHIDAEDSVILPEAGQRLVRHGVRDLPDSTESAPEAAARATGERLTAIYAPASDFDAIRGEGCIMCPSYGAGCLGLEREWWTDQEWEDVHLRQDSE